MMTGIPPDHPINERQARRMVESELGDVQRDMLRDAMLPLYWHERIAGQEPGPILNSGTLTIARTSSRVLGLTAAHVVRGYLADKAQRMLTLQLLNAGIDDLDIIAISDRLDLATINLSDEHLRRCGKQISPISILEQGRHEPHEGRGIMFGGYPGIGRSRLSAREVEWGVFGALGIARRVTDEQITWVAERDDAVEHPNIPTLPPNAELGGISGGPMVAWFERHGGMLSYGSLVAIVSQANPNLENVVAKRIHYIADDGAIREPR